MKLTFDQDLAINYKSTSQKIRVLSEQWVGDTIFCPNCGQYNISKYPNNQPVADFFCSNCQEEYELKSKQKSIGTKIVDGAYRTMLERLTGGNNPNFFFLNYNLTNLEVTNFFVIPKHFFVPKIIEKRNPLASTARRAGWVGCNILLSYIPLAGRIFFIRDQHVESKEKVLADWKKTLFLRKEKEVESKGWILDVMNCIDKLDKKNFSLKEIYNFEKELNVKHPNNKHIKDKIRQQLQFLRDKDYLEFLGNGKYKLN